MGSSRICSHDSWSTLLSMMGTGAHSPPWPSPSRVAHQQGAYLLAVPVDHRTLEDAAAGMGIPEVEPSLRLLAGIVGVAVEVEAVAEIGAVVGEELDVVPDVGLAPDLGRVGHVEISRGLESSGIVALHRAHRGPGVAVLQAQVGPGALVAQADVAGDAEQLAVAEELAVAVEEAAGLGLDGDPFVVVLQLEVHHPGDGVGPVLGRGAVAQDLHPLEGDGRDDGQVGTLGAVGHAVAEPVDHRGAVAALAVDQHQGVVGRQAPQVGRPDDGPRVADGLGVDVVRGHDVPQQVGQVGAALLDELLAADDVDGHGRLRYGARLGAGARDHDFLEHDLLLELGDVVFFFRFLRQGRGYGAQEEQCAHAEGERQDWEMEQVSHRSTSSVQGVDVAREDQESKNNRLYEKGGRRWDGQVAPAPARSGRRCPRTRW